MDKKDLYELLNSWDNLPLAINEISGNPGIFQDLMEISLYGKEKNSWRASYMADKIHENHPQEVAAHPERLLCRLSERYQIFDY